MKIRIPLVFFLTLLFFWSCDEPTPYENDDFTYNPFTIFEDTLQNITSIQSGDAEIAWENHFRAWVGETRYYKSGFTVDFVFSDTSLDIGEVDSIQFQVQHVLTYPEVGSDSLAADFHGFAYYETMDQSIDLANSVYGTFLGTDSMNITGGNNVWKYTLPDSLIHAGDTTASLGIFPVGTDYMSSFYGGGSVSRPKLLFYFHEPDTAGNDSATSISFDADAVHMYLEEKAASFDRTQYDYISQLREDSVSLTIDLTSFETTGDTLQHIIASQILPGIDDGASALYRPDTLFRFSMLVIEPVSGLSTTIEYGGSGTYNSNRIRTLIQPSIDDKLDAMELTLKATNAGYNPGFIAISKDPDASLLYVKSSLAVRP